MELEYLKKCNICQSNNLFYLDKNNNISGCRDCGYIFDNPRPVSDEIIKFYSQFTKYDFWLKNEDARYLMWLRRLKKIRKYKKSGALLDIGTGIGQFLNFARDYFEISGTEVSESAIDIAKQKYNLNLIKGKIEDVNFRSSKFDIITIFHVLEHVENPSADIKKCKDLLKKEGVIIVAVPNDIFSARALIRQLLTIFKIGKFRKRGRFGLSKITLDGSLDEIHVSHFTESVLKNLIIKNNLSIIEVGLDPYYALLGCEKFINHLFYLFCLLIKKVFRINIYDTILLVAKKN